jgi:hypothetical protein
MQGVDRPPVLVDLEVHVRSRRPSGIAHQRHRLSPPHPLSLSHDIAFIMSVEGHEATAVVEYHDISIAAWPTPTKPHHSRFYRHDRCPGRTGDIDTTMQAAASHAET